MSKADKMFEELGFRIYAKNNSFIKLDDVDGDWIDIRIEERSYKHNLRESTLNHHLAFHELFKELGWLDDSR